MSSDEFHLKLPSMGESVSEASIISWLKEVGDLVSVDEAIVEVATDKVDSEVLSEVSGILIKKNFEKGDVIKVGQDLCVIKTEKNEPFLDEKSEGESIKISRENQKKLTSQMENLVKKVEKTSILEKEIENKSTEFYSPLIRKIVETEGICKNELDAIKGTGLNFRITKNDILSYLVERRKTNNDPKAVSLEKKEIESKIESSKPMNLSAGDQIITLSNIGKIISNHMLHSRQKASHVQSFIEIDVTNIVKWMEKAKDVFFQREGMKLTYTPIFMMAIVQAIKKYPLVNITFDGVDKVVVKKSIHLGMASALPDGNLIVPVIKDAENLNLEGMIKKVDDLTYRSKNNKLKPDDIKGGTYTVSNVGVFGTLFGTPIINQPESAILAIGAIRKVPSVIETPVGDSIGIRQKMIVSHSYDHRVINGALGGMLIKELKIILESWDIDRNM